LQLDSRTRERRHGEHGQPVGLRFQPEQGRNGMTSLLAASHLKGPHIDWAGLSPLLALLGGATVVLLVGLLSRGWVRRQLVPALALASLAATLGLTLWQWGDYQSLIAGALRIDALTQVLTLVLVAGGACTVLLAWRSNAA